MISFFPFFDNGEDYRVISAHEVLCYQNEMIIRERDIKITRMVLVTDHHCALTMCQAQVNHNHFLIYSPPKSWEEGVIILT